MAKDRAHAFAPLFAERAEVRVALVEAAALEKVPLRVHHSLYEDETSAYCHWHIPAAHELESWGDARSFDLGRSFALVFWIDAATFAKGPLAAAPAAISPVAARGGQKNAPRYVQVGANRGAARTIKHSIEMMPRASKVDWLAQVIRQGASGPVLEIGVPPGTQVNFLWEPYL